MQICYVCDEDNTQPCVRAHHPADDPPGRPVPVCVRS